MKRTAHKFYSFQTESASKWDLIKIAREMFGDNDVFQPYNQRRWTTQGTMHDGILIKTHEDAMWLRLKLPNCTINEVYL